MAASGAGRQGEGVCLRRGPHHQLRARREQVSTRGSRPSSMVINKEVMEDSVCQVNLAEEEVAKSSTCGELRGLQGSGGLDQRHECPVAL